MNADPKGMRRLLPYRPRHRWGTALASTLVVVILAGSGGATAWAATPAEAKPAAKPDQTPLLVVEPLPAPAAIAQAAPKAEAAPKAQAAPKAELAKPTSLKALLTSAAPAGSPSAPKAAETDKPTTAPAPKEPPPPAGPKAINDGDGYPVSKFMLKYGREHPDQPPLEPFLRIPVALGKMAKGYVLPRPGIATTTVHLADFTGARTETFHASAIRRINEEIVAAFNQAGLVGIYVAPDEKDLDPKTGKDNRAAGNTVLHLVIWSATVSRVRTLGGGERVPEAERIDNPAHQRIRERTPVQSNDLLWKSKLDDYVFFLNRHPGRQVDAAVTSGARSGEVALDYLVSESKPWLAYAQTSNTGTEATSKWRHRFGFIHNQLTGNDDILSGEYTTSGFDEPEAQSASGSYEAPFFGMDKLRWRVYGDWAQFRADVKGGGVFGQEFDGYEWRLGGEMIANVFQHKETFLDAIAGVTWWHLHVLNQGTNIVGDADAFLNYLGLRIERMTDIATTVGQATIEFNCPGIAKSDEEDLARLGRDPVDRDWVLLKWDFLQTFFLEPLFNRKAWLDASTPASSTLAHEMAFQFRGQYAMNGYRMIPQNERVIGGFFTVRGYPESSTAGDTALVATAEYRLHIPRLLKPEGNPAKTPLPLVGTPFRWAPQTVYSRPDWDLIARAFFDIGRATNVDRLPFEEDFTLIGTGIGVEVQFTRYFNVRLDMGIPCRDLDTTSQSVQAGEPRVHFVATVLY